MLIKSLFFFFTFIDGDRLNVIKSMENPWNGRLRMKEFYLKNYLKQMHVMTLKFVGLWLLEHSKKLGETYSFFFFSSFFPFLNVSLPFFHFTYKSQYPTHFPFRNPQDLRWRWIRLCSKIPNIQEKTLQGKKMVFWFVIEDFENIIHGVC